MIRAFVGLASMFALLASSLPAAAQAPAPAPPPVWTVAASAGLALTSGNSDTSTVNVAYDLVYNPGTRNVVKSDALYLRGENQGKLASNRLNVNLRDEYSLNARTFVFGQNQYLQDEFKSIDYLIAPTAGLGYKVIDTAPTKFSVDAGIGGVWEKNAIGDVHSSGAVTFSEKLNHALTSTTALTHGFSALWKTKDWEDALYTFGAGVAVSMSTRTQLKVELLDVYKNKPPTPAVGKNDLAILMAIVYKM